MNFELRPCKGKAGLTANPKKQMRLNLLEKTSKFNCLVETKPMLIVDIEGILVNIYDSGKIRIPVQDEEKAMEIAEKIYQVIV